MSWRGSRSRECTWRAPTIRPGALSTLSEREAEVIRLYFGLDREHSLTLEEIGERFQLTRERVRQIKEKAIRRLRHTSRSKSLRAYLG